MELLFVDPAAAHDTEQIVGLRRLLAKELKSDSIADWLDDELHTRWLYIHFELERRELRDDTVASQLQKLLLGLKPDQISCRECVVAGDEPGSTSFGFRLKAFWEPTFSEGRPIDKRRNMPQDRGNIDPSAMVEDKTRDGPSPSPATREGSDMGDLCTTDAQLLFETVKSFRAIRDRHRLGKLARALSLDVPSGEDPTIHEVEKLINRLAGKSFGSFEVNHLAAQEIQGMLNDLGFRIACPKARCQKAATLHHTPGKGMRKGMFVFVHSCATGQAHHGGWAALPETLSLLPAQAKSKPSRSPANHH